MVILKQICVKKIYKKIFLKLIPWAALALWMLSIAFLSHQPATLSNKLSTRVTEVIVQVIEKIVHDTDIDIDIEIDIDVKSFNNFIRKYAHFFSFMLLGILFVNALRKNGVREYRSIAFALIFCVLFAISDEIHQCFVSGRGAQVKDVLIDSAGASVGILGYSAIKCLLQRWKKK